MEFPRHKVTTQILIVSPQKVGFVVSNRGHYKIAHSWGIKLDANIWYWDVAGS